MSSTMQIASTETAVIRLFEITLPKDQIAAFSEPTDTDGLPDWPLREALGAGYLDEEYVEVFPVSDLDELGLAGYLMEGHGVSEDQIKPLRLQLDAIKGHVLLVVSKAFGGMEQTLTPKGPLHFIATFTEDRAPVTFEPLPSEAAKPEVVEPTKKKVSDAAMSGRVATFALLFMFAFIAAMIWIGS